MQSFLPSPPTSTHIRSTIDGRFRTASPAPAANGTDESIDSKAIDSLLNELAVVLARWNLYVKFLAVKCQVTVPGNRIDTKYGSPILEIPKFVTNAALSNKILRIRSSFESLETFFFRRSVEKAFQLDEPSHQSGPPTTSVIDDVMFVLRKVLDRAMGTGDADLLKTICANTRRILDLDFAGVIKRRATMDRTILGTGKFDDIIRREKIRPFIAELNNLNISSESVKALTEGYLSGNLDGLFPFGNQLDIAKSALLNVGSLKSRFDGYLHVVLVEMILMIRRAWQRSLHNSLNWGSRSWLTMFLQACNIP